jgi:transcriptional regulator PpsR
MDEKRSSLARIPENGRSFSTGKLAGFDSARAAMVVGAAGDVALVVDRDGVICDMAIMSSEIERDGAAAWLGQRWSDTTNIDSRHKVDLLLGEALKGDRSQWRELSQFTPLIESVILRYTCIKIDSDNSIIAIGRDDRVASYMHQRLIESQQTAERDYSQLRDAKARYLMLFQTSSEAFIVVDMTTKRIVEANPSAEQLLTAFGPRMIGQPFVKLFDGGSQYEAASLLTGASQFMARTKCPSERLVSGGRELMVSAFSLRQGRAAQCLVRLAPATPNAPSAPEADPHSLVVLERIPDAFVITDTAMRMLNVNAAFLDMTGIATKQQAVGQVLSQFLGRAGLERNVLVDTLRDHGSVQNFSTVLRNRFADQEDVVISAVSVADSVPEVFGFMIRRVRSRHGERLFVEADAQRSVEQLAELIGKMKLKDLVRESTDIVERLCIESALELTKGNRAAAADLLGLSRQSLYSKLHRFGLGTVTDTDH